VNAVKSYFAIAGMIFLILAALGAICGAAFGGVLLVDWVWNEIHPIAAVPVAMVLLALGLAAVFVVDESE